MNPRPFWVRQILDAWEKRPIVWLSGVRRVGKTTLARMLPEITYLNCDLPSVCRMLADPEAFFGSLAADSRIVLDEVHRLDEPSRVLKVAADAYPGLRVLATGSSTLAATRKFRDSLTGRKVPLYLAPVLWRECLDGFGVADLDRRLLHGGLPEPLLASARDPAYFAEWLDSFYARDIQELFAIRNRSGFMRLLRLVLRQSGGLLVYSSLAKLSGLSRVTVMSHIEALCVARAAFLLPPFHGGGRRELTRRPKCYAFDTGFVAFERGWERIREDDRGLLWEHLVLDALRASVGEHALHYWRDKSGREVDFVVARAGGRVDAIECEIAPDRFDVSSLAVFRSAYPEGENYVVSPAAPVPYERRHGELLVTYCNGTQFPWSGA